MSEFYGYWDGDSLVWRFGWIEDPTSCIRNTSEFIAKCHAEAGVKEAKFFLGSLDKSNFRYRVDPKYKSSRKDTKRPANEILVRNYLVEQRGGIIIRGAEADDALGIAQCNYRTTSSEEKKPSAPQPIIFSNDKDLDMIPGWHYDLDFHRAINYNGKVQIRKAYKKNKIYKVVDPGFLSLRKVKGRSVLCGAGQLWFCAQLLLGDSADDILGVAKLSGTRLGPVAAYDILKDAKTFEEGIKLCYTIYMDRIVENTEVRSRFIRNCKLLWIKRKPGKENIFPLEWLK